MIFYHKLRHGRRVPTELTKEIYQTVTKLFVVAMFIFALWAIFTYHMIVNLEQ